MLLTPGAYFWTDDFHMGPFGLYMAQNPTEPILPYTIWYNQSGEMLGWGHLTKENITKIRRYIPQDEMFVIVNWATLERDRKLGLTTEKLSVSRLSEAAAMVIETRQIWQKGLFDDLNVEIAHKLPAKTVTISTLASKLLKTERAVVL